MTDMMSFLILIYSREVLTCKLWIMTNLLIICETTFQLSLLTLQHFNSAIQDIWNAMRYNQLIGWNNQTVFCSVLTVNQLSAPPVHVELSPVHVKSSWHHPHTPLVITHSLHLWTESNGYDISNN